MADYTSLYTGAQIDNAVASGSSVTGKINLSQFTLNNFIF